MTTCASPSELALVWGAIVLPLALAPAALAVLAHRQAHAAWRVGAALFSIAPVAFMLRGGPAAVLDDPIFALAFVALVLAGVTHLAALRLAVARWPALALALLGAAAWIAGFAAASTTPCP